MSLILGIDTSSIELSMGLVRDGKPVLSCSRYVRNSHAEQISRLMRYVLESSGITVHDITHAAIAVGPGSFTGLRIGIAFLKGFFFEHDTPVLPLSSLEVLAASYPCTDTRIIPVIDARGQKVFSSLFKRHGDSLTRLSVDRILSLQQFSISYKKNDILILDTLGYSRSAVRSSLQEWGTIHTVEEIPLHRGLACARLANGMISDSVNWKNVLDILPEYMQESYAHPKK
jgi:tRNA threonylcarbamoyladenosine biosynthesis protein TsaB